MADEVKCTECDREFTDQPNEYPGKVYVHKSEMVCEDCLVASGVLHDHADPDHTYLLTEEALYFAQY